MITMREYAPGEVIIWENDIGETAYTIERGRVEVSKEQEGRNIHLAYLGPGQTFGEMSLIDEKPRSATITAILGTVVHEIHRDEFLPNLHAKHEVSISLLKVIFERLREANATILQLYTPASQPAQPLAEPLPDVSGTADTVVFLEGLTSRAIMALPTNPFQIHTFPFRVGRVSYDSLVLNDLMLPDSEPLQISRHHVSFIKHAGRIGVMDRLSRLGSLVDGQRMGGPEGNLGPLFFSRSEGTLVLGSDRSPFRYKVSIRIGGQVPPTP